MKIDKKSFKTLKKDGGGILRQKFVVTAYHEFGLDEQVGCSGLLTLLDNGLFFDITFGNKYYFQLDNITNITRKNNKLGIETNEENIILRINSEKDLEKAYKKICNTLGLEMTKTEKQELFERIMSSNPEISKKTMETNKKTKGTNEVSCPKCHSTSIKYIDKALEQRLTLGDDLANMNYLLGNGKVENGVLRCLNCGYSWKLKYKKKK